MKLNAHSSWVAKCVFCKVHVLQSACVAKCICCKLHMLQSAHVVKCMCFKVHMCQSVHVVKFTCCKVALSQHVDIASNSKILYESKEVLGHRLKISYIGYNEAFHLIPHKILPHFDVNNIAVAQN